jgi:hypothetical protein
MRCVPTERYGELREIGFRVVGTVRRNRRPNYSFPDKKAMKTELRESS